MRDEGGKLHSPVGYCINRDCPHYSQRARLYPASTIPHLRQHHPLQWGNMKKTVFSYGVVAISLFTLFITTVLR
jgi:hypothetical protein